MGPEAVSSPGLLQTPGAGRWGGREAMRRADGLSHPPAAVARTASGARPCGPGGAAGALTMTLLHVPVFLVAFSVVCPGDARSSPGGRRHTPRGCWSCEGTGPTPTAKEDKEEKGVRGASAEGRARQAVGHCPEPLSAAARGQLGEPVAVCDASSGFRSMHPSNPKVRDSPSGNAQR